MCQWPRHNCWPYLYCICHFIFLYVFSISCSLSLSALVVQYKQLDRSVCKHASPGFIILSYLWLCETATSYYYTTNCYKESAMMQMMQRNSLSFPFFYWTAFRQKKCSAGPSLVSMVQFFVLIYFNQPKKIVFFLEGGGGIVFVWFYILLCFEN